MPKLLIIDDNEEISSLLKMFFQSREITIYTAFDGASGIEKAMKLNPDVITLDFNMPGMNGVEVYDELHRRPETAGIPVIFFSSTLLGIIQRMITDNPRVRFLKKPCNPRDIERCVSEMLAMPKLAPPPPPPAPKNQAQIEEQSQTKAPKDKPDEELENWVE
ncbi:MAG: response regulator [Elusimicrobiales bacterium]|jgi:CheY-like chemotaxis protein